MPRREGLYICKLGIGVWSLNPQALHLLPFLLAGFLQSKMPSGFSQIQRPVLASLHDMSIFLLGFFLTVLSVLWEFWPISVFRRFPPDHGGSIRAAVTNPASIWRKAFCPWRWIRQHLRESMPAKLPNPPPPESREYLA